MSPKKRNPENKGLPERWRYRRGAYYYRVPLGMESHWGGKKEFRLGKTLSEAYRVYSERLVVPDQLETMRDLFNRYRLEVIPTKALATQKTDLDRILNLELVFEDNPASMITTQDCYRVLYAMTRKRGESTANSHIALLSHVFTKAIQWGVLTDHPIKGKLIKNQVKVSRHIPTIQDIESALSVASPTIAAYVRFKLLTGLRQADILTIKLSDIHDDGLHITPRKTRFSSGKSLIIEWDESGILKQTINDIRSAKSRVSSIWLFSNRKGEPYFKDGKASGFKSIWQRWQKKAMKETSLSHRFTERSIRTLVGSSFETAEEAARLLAHADTKTTRRHYREKPEKVQPLANLWGRDTSMGQSKNNPKKGGL